MGFKRQLTSAEIFEQAYRFAQELSARGERLTNVVGSPEEKQNHMKRKHVRVMCFIHGKLV